MYLHKIGSEECAFLANVGLFSHGAVVGYYNRTALTHFQVSSLMQKGREKVFEQERQKGSTTEQQVPPQMEESNIPKEQEEGEADPKIKLMIRAHEVMEEFEGCKTPTWSSNKIPVIQNCPPAPRKKRRSLPPFSSRMMKRSSPSESNYIVKPEEVESFFQSMFELTRVNKRCRSI